MHTIKAVVRNGRIEVDEPLDLPDGTELDIPLPDDGPMSQEDIDLALVAMDRMEALGMTDEELAAWETDRGARRDAEKATFFERAEAIRKECE